MIRGHVPAGQLAVEVGTGTGLITGALDSASRVVCIDRYPDMLRRFDASAMSVSLICADAEALPLAGNIASVVVAANLLHLVPNADAVIAEMGRVARVDGLIVFTWPDPTMSVPLTYRLNRPGVSGDRVWCLTRSGQDGLLQRSRSVLLAVVSSPGWTRGAVPG